MAHIFALPCHYILVKLTLKTIWPTQAHRRHLMNTSNILVVEDNKINQLIAEDMLKKSGFQITIVDNGQQAIDIIKQKQFDLVLMDIQMPVMDGETATRLLKNDPDYKHIPIVAMTANVMKHEIENYLNIGFSAFIGKPFILEDILKVINNTLNN